MTEIPEPSAPADELDGLLSEFDAASAPKPEAPAPVAAEPTAPQPLPPSFQERLLQSVADRDRRIAEASKPKHDAPAPSTAESQELAELRNWASGIEAERAAQREKADAEVVFAKAHEVAVEIAPWLPPDMARAWIVNEAMTDPALSSAWENRHASPEAAGIAQRQIDRALRKLGKHLRSMPDPNTTEDRNLVTAAVRGASGPPPPERQPDYAKMYDNGAFKAVMKEKYGIDLKL